MNIKRYAKDLMELKDKELSLRWFLGVKWVLIKIFLLAVAIYAVLQPILPVKGMGIFVFGYLFGVVAYDIRAYILGKRKWELQKKLYDWNKIESLAKEETDSD